MLAAFERSVAHVGADVVDLDAAALVALVAAAQPLLLATLLAEDLAAGTEGGSARERGQGGMCS